MQDRYLYETLDVLNEYGNLIDYPTFIEKGLNNSINLREYQKDALKYFVNYYENPSFQRNGQLHTLFHMATGSGKTVIMASLILYLYTKGYRKFLFFVNQTNIIEKTKENFTNPKSYKYLFSDRIEYLGQEIRIKIVENFSLNPVHDIVEICFTSTQKLHYDLTTPKENSITYFDFSNNKIVFISDESHHVNSNTKNPSRTEEEQAKSWEYSVSNAFALNRENILLEFTATADIKDPLVEEKYRDKIIFNYPLIRFRESGFTKDIQNFATDTDLWGRSLIALVLSEYRKFLFSDLHLNIKPVIMMKSQTINESEVFYSSFFRRLENLSYDELEELYKTDVSILSCALDYFKNKFNSLDFLVHSLKNSFKREYSIIMNGKAQFTKENQLLVNSLEDQKNHIRVIFAVDMLNEGWDVLNLFDIVRLYDTRQGSGKPGKIGSYTIKEAQLIGRGARYFPFKISDFQDSFKRKFDNDININYRILETMFFHCKNDSRYISELKQALIASGLHAEKPIVLKYQIKEEFKKTEFYNSGLVFSNKRIPKDRREVKMVDDVVKNLVYKHHIVTQIGEVSDLLVRGKSSSEKVEISSQKIMKIRLKDVQYNILSGAASRYYEFNYSVVKEIFPNIKSIREFLLSDDYLGNIQLEITYANTVSGKELNTACKNALLKVATYISSIEQKYEGSKIFEPIKLNSILRDKMISINYIDNRGGRGESQIFCSNDDYRLDLTQENWYILNDNFGTSEEKLFIKFFKNKIEPALKQNNLEYYVLKNERIPELAIFSFEHGERFEPDFLLLLKQRGNDRSKHQIYIEPKGNHLIKHDEWKEVFLRQLEQNALIPFRQSNLDSVKIIGLPFYNHQQSKNFEEVFISILSELFNIDV